MTKTALVVLVSLLAVPSFAGRPGAPRGHVHRGGNGNAGTGSTTPTSWTGAQTHAEEAEREFHSKRGAYEHAKGECAEAGGVSSDVQEREREKREACDKASAAHNAKTQALNRWKEAAKQAQTFANNELKNAKDDAAKKTAQGHVGWANTAVDNSEHTQ